MTQLRSDSRSLRVLATEAIRQLVVDRDLQAGDRIPSEQELCTLLGASRTTIREALKALEHEGLLQSRQGAGTFVAQVPPRAFDLMDLDFLRRSGEVLERYGLHEEFGYHAIGEEAAGAETAEWLGVEPGTPLVVLERIRSADGEPLGYFRVEIITVPGLREALEEARPPSVRAFLRDRYGHAIDRVVANLAAIGAPSDIAGHLRVSEGFPLLRIDQIRYEVSGRGVYCTRGYWRTDRFTFQLVRKAQRG